MSDPTKPGKTEWLSLVLAALVVILGLSMCTGCTGKPKRHNAPDRTKLEAAIVRVERAIPVVQRSHEQIGRRVAKAKENQKAIRDGHSVEKAKLEAIKPQIARVKELAFRTHLDDVALLELREEVSKLDSTVEQLASAQAVTTVSIEANETDIGELAKEHAAHGANIEEVKKAKDQALAEATVVLNGYDEKIDRLNFLEAEVPKLKTENFKLKALHIFNKVWNWVSGIGAGVLALAFALGKVGLR